MPKNPSKETIHSKQRKRYMNKNSVTKHFKHVNSRGIATQFTHGCACNRHRENATALRPKFHRIGGHRLHLLDRRIFQLDHDGQRTNKTKLSARVARLLRKFHAQPNCRRVRIPTAVQPRPEFDSPPLTLVEQSASALMEEGPLDTWSAVQDLWRRLGVICPVKVTIFDDGFELAFADALAQDWDLDSVDLIARVLDPHSYRWHQEGWQGDLAQCVEMHGNDLLILSTSLQQISRWPDGQEIVCLMKCYLMQTRNTLTAASECAAGTPLNFTTKFLKGQPT